MTYNDLQGAKRVKANYSLLCAEIIPSDLLPHLLCLTNSDKVRIILMIAYVKYIIFCETHLSFEIQKTKI